MFSRNFKILDFFSGLYVGSFRGNISDGLPVIYCGVIGALFVSFYFVNPTIKRRQKICTAVMFAFLIAGYWIDALNVVWIPLQELFSLFFPHAFCRLHGICKHKGRI